MSFEDTETQYAPFWSRILAHNIDLLVMLGFAYALSFFIESDRILLILLFTIYALYNAFFEMSSWQGSLGKKMVRIKVSTVRDAKLDVFQSLVRNFTKILSLGVFFLGLLWILVDKRNQGWHDKLAGTTVISL